MSTGRNFLESEEAGYEVDHSPPPNAVVKKRWSYTSTPAYVFME
jgi:hypothetical protein